MNTTTETREQFLWDVFVTAMEGGVNYWADVLSYHPSAESKDDLFNFRAKIRDQETGERFDVNSQTIERGLQLCRHTQLADRIRAAILLGEAKNDGGCVDAEAADCIVQAALFGEVIYG